jgi:carboxypeptidase C (cathepsin A)
MEIGPYRVKDATGPKLEYNGGSWDEFANIMFVDNPVGTGYSFVDTDSYTHELPEMADRGEARGAFRVIIKCSNSYEHQNARIANDFVEWLLLEDISDLRNALRFGGTG